MENCFDKMNKSKTDGCRKKKTYAIIEGRK